MRGAAESFGLSSAVQHSQRRRISPPHHWDGAERRQGAVQPPRTMSAPPGVHNGGPDPPSHHSSSCASHSVRDPQNKSASSVLTPLCSEHPAVGTALGNLGDKGRNERFFGVCSSARGSGTPRAVLEQRGVGDKDSSTPKERYQKAAGGVRLSQGKEEVVLQPTALV